MFNGNEVTCLVIVCVTQHRQGQTGAPFQCHAVSKRPFPSYHHHLIPQFYRAQSTYDTPSFLDATAKIPNTRIPTNGRQPSAPYLPGIPPITQNISSGQDSNNMSFHNSSLDSPQNFIARPPQQPTSLKQRRTSFLNGLATFMSSCGTPLPPTLTGISYPQNYDPSTSPWKFIEPSQTEIGSFRLAGKDVDLFKLWGLVLQAGGGTNVTSFPVIS